MFKLVLKKYFWKLQIDDKFENLLKFASSISNSIH